MKLKFIRVKVKFTSEEKVVILNKLFGEGQDIYLNDLDFGNKRVFLDGIKGLFIDNSRQQAKNIRNDFQTASGVIMNNKQGMNNLKYGSNSTACTTSPKKVNIFKKLGKFLHTKWS